MIGCLLLLGRAGSRRDFDAHRHRDFLTAPAVNKSSSMRRGPGASVVKFRASNAKKPDLFPRPGFLVDQAWVA
jgi:hypothetical protein